MKKFLVLILALVFALTLVSCGGEETPDASTSSSQSGSQSGDSGTSSSDDEANIPDVPPDSSEQIGPGGSVDSSNSGSSTGSSQGGNDGGDDKPENPTESYVAETVLGVLGDMMDPFTAEDTFGGNSGQTSSYTSYKMEFDLSKLSAGKRIEILEGGIYRVYGKSLNGQIYIKAKGQNVILLLDGVDLISTTSVPAIYAEDCASVKIELAEGSVNKLEDTEVNGENGVIKVKSCNLTMGGKGKLTIKANAKNGISNTKELTINGGVYNITSTKHGIYGKLGVTINGGQFTIESARSGIKSGDDEVNNVAEGKTTINNGSLHIRCNTDGINAYGSVEITNGRVVIEAKSRGIDATKDIAIKGGILILSTENDAIRTSKATYDDNGKTVSAGSTISIEGKANVKIASYGNGAQAEKVSISTTGVLYIYTALNYVEDTNGTYKLVNGSYVLIAEGEKYIGKRYNPLECKGIEAAKSIEINGANVGIDSYEDCLNSTDIKLKNSTVVLATTKDAIEASNEADVTASITVEGLNGYLNVVKADKGLKAKTTVTLSDGTTKIYAITDAIKADTVSVLSGRHIFFDKVEYVTDFVIRGGSVLCISTTVSPVAARSAIPNASGVIASKDLCVMGRELSIVMGTQSESAVLPKDYTEKICVFYATIDETMGICRVTIGEETEKLTTGKFY